MAITKLPTDYIDSVTSETKYKMTNLGDSEYLIEDVSTYSVTGSDWGANQIKQTSTTVNSTIDASNTNSSVIQNIKSGATSVYKASFADKVNTATSCKTATKCTSATSSTSATKTSKITGGGKINGVAFDGTANITVYDSTKLSKDQSFTVVNKSALTFKNKVCTISDSRITADSLAEVIFTKDCIEVAKTAVITVETVSGAVNITAGRTPASTLTASVYIRVV